MTPERSGASRYREISRRTFLRRSAAVALTVAIPGPILAACRSDVATFESAAAATTVPSSTTTGAQESAMATSTTTTDQTSTEARVSGTTFPPAAELVVDFTYSAESTTRGGVQNPYVAVWVEDQAGELVATIALWFLQSQKGTKWLSDLRRWATVDGSTATIDAISSATRRPGGYSVVWDGTDMDGNLVTQGEYYIAIESAREHGPYSLIREQISLGADGFTRALNSEGELSDATVSLILA